MKKAIVTTTINSPTEALIKYAEKPGWDLIVIGDVITPHDEFEKRDDLIYLGPRAQMELYPALSEAIGWSCIQRRNIGFVYAYHSGYEIIATIDDDNIPYDDWGSNVEVGNRIDVEHLTQDGVFFDPIKAVIDYNDLGIGYNLWHRGFPVQDLDKRNTWVASEPHPDFDGIGSRISTKVKVQADFWDGDPDIDAVSRITNNHKIHFNQFEKFAKDQIGKIKGSPILSPFNSQNTFLSRDVIPYYMMIPHVGRMDDIWGAYIYQQIMSEMGEQPGIIFSKPTVYQDRNDHDLTKDLENEVIGYRNTYRFAQEPYRDILPEAALKAFDAYRNEFKK